MAVNRRQFLKKAGQAAFVAAAGAGSAECQEGQKSASTGSKNKKGSQRLSIRRLKEWEALKYGMFICYGMSTFSKQGQHPCGQAPLSTYAPQDINIDQWVSVARDAGMKYAVLTAKSENGQKLRLGNVGQRETGSLLFHGVRDPILQSPNPAVEGRSRDPFVGTKLVDTQTARLTIRQAILPIKIIIKSG